MSLTRRLGYYTGPVFEVSIDGYGFSIAGGGRYDKMIGRFSGADVCASGFSIGFERILTILKDHMGESLKVPENSVAYLIDKKAPLEKKMEAFAQAKELRETGVIVSVQPMRKNVKRQVELLEAEGYREFRKVYGD